MLELLILYTLNKTELTLYGIRKYISDYFNEVSIPSHGALLPALRRLCDKNIINVRKKVSDGGKLYSFYSVNAGFRSYFSNLFLEIKGSDKVSVEMFLQSLKVRLLVYDILDVPDLSSFKEKTLLILRFYKDKLENKLQNKFIELNEVQTKVVKNYLVEIKEYTDIVASLV